MKVHTNKFRFYSLEILRYSVVIRTASLNLIKNMIPQQTHLNITPDICYHHSWASISKNICQISFHSKSSCIVFKENLIHSQWLHWWYLVVIIKNRSLLSWFYFLVVEYWSKLIFKEFLKVPQMSSWFDNILENFEEPDENLFLKVPQKICKVP